MSKTKKRGLDRQVSSKTENPPNKKRKAEDVDDEETEELDLEDLDDAQCEMSEYERRREENLRDNAQFIASIKLHEAKLEFELTTKYEKAKQGKPLRKKTNTSPKVGQPIRRSARIQHVAPSRVIVETEVKTEVINPRKPPENLEMEENLSEGDKERNLQFANNLKSLIAESTSPELKEPDSMSLKKFLQDFSRVKITEERIRKVVNSRIFSLVVHPTVDKVLVGAGGKWGSIGLWDVNQGLSEDAAVMYYPHTSPVNCLEFNPHNHEQLFSCSYDGILRCGNFENNVFENIYYTPEDEGLLLRNFAFLSPHILLVAQSDGNVALIDKRTDGYKAEHLFRVSPKDIRTVDIHPTERTYIVTAGLDSALCLWDIRYVKKTPKNIWSVTSRRMLNSGYFSPVTGKHILVTSQDNQLRIYDSSKLTAEPPNLHSIRHNTQSGRWLTKFRANWHPSREDLFVCGSMERVVVVYSTKGHRIKELQDRELVTSIQSLTKFHPTLNVLVGANASGRLHVFMEDNK